MRQRTADAIIRKMDFLDKEIAKSTDLIEKWRDKIVDINKDIKDASKKLADAKHWQKEYNSAIKETADELKRVTDERKSVEERIARLEIEIRREQLQASLEWAKATEDATLIAIKEGQLKAFESEQRQLEHIERIGELKRLQEELPKVIARQKDAEIAAKAAEAAAKLEIQAKQQELRDFIIAKKAERDQLDESIKKEEERIAVLKEDLRLTGLLLDILGIKRTSELGAMNASIGALIAHGYALETERNKLRDLLDITGPVISVFGRLGNAFIDAANAANAAIASLLNQSVPMATPEMSTPEGLPPGWNNPSNEIILPPPPIDLIDALTNLGLGGMIGIPQQFAHGGMVQHDGLAMVHAGEEFKPAWKSRDSGGVSNTTYAPNLQVNLYMDGGSNSDKQSMRRFVRTEVIPEIIDAMEVNAGRVTKRMSKLLAPYQQDGAVGKSTPRMVLK